MRNVILLILAGALGSGLCAQPRAPKAAPLSNNDSILLSGVNYRLVGPWRGGRSAAVAGSLRQRNTFYFGATGGGVWKTTDGGHHWKNVSDKY